MAPVSTHIRRTQTERSATTRAALLAAARELFTERGFAGTGREDIAERAGVTRGALYHHFDSKAAAFVAVVDELEAELVARLVAAARRGATPREQLQCASRAYIDACAEPPIARILLTDAPSVLGMAECRARDAASCGQMLDRALADGLDLPGERDVAIALLLGLLNEAAALVASSPHPKRERRRVAASVDAFLDRLLQPQA
jgi:AcrR family transcriptional regulator